VAPRRQTCGDWRWHSGRRSDAQALPTVSPQSCDANHATGLTCRLRGYDARMIVVGLVLLLLGFLLGIPLLWTLGVIVLIVGVVLMLLGSTGRAVGGRRHYW
jgi:hypothetical protein